MNWEVKFFNDRCTLRDIPTSIADVLRQNGLVTQSGEKASFCGLVSSGKNFAVFTPRKTEISISKSKVSTFLFKALRKYDKELSSLIKSDSEIFGLIGGQKISLIYNLIEDYKNYGTYSQRNLQKKNNSGKPDWPRTIEKYQPYLSENGPVYCDYIGVKKKASVDSEISRIHAYIIKSLDSLFGLVFFGEKSYQEDGLLKPSCSSPEFFKSIIKKELRNVYSDRDIRLLKMLLRAIEIGIWEHSENVILGTRSFHTIWEHMLKKVISGTVDLNDKLPFPIYKDIEGKSFPAKRNSQKTDIVVENAVENLYAIVDAKYYDAIDLGSIPKWHDLVKQFFYEKAISSIYPDSTIKNYFVFPGSEQVFSNAYMADKSNYQKVDEYAEIECLYVDPLEVTQAYTKGTKLKELSIKLNS